MSAARILTLAVIVPPLTYAVMLIGAMGSDSHTEWDIAQPRETVSAALAGLDVRDLPHTKAKLSREERRDMPLILRGAGTETMDWFVMGEGKTVLRMSAKLEPAADGRGTHVTTSVEEGQAPDAGKMPDLFRSPGKMAPLFAVAVERAMFDYIPKGERSLYAMQDRPWGYDGD